MNNLNNQITDGLNSVQINLNSILDEMKNKKPEEQTLLAANAKEHRETFEILEELVNDVGYEFFSESVDQIKNSFETIRTNKEAAKQLIEISKKIEKLPKNITDSKPITELKKSLDVIAISVNLNQGNFNLIRNLTVTLSKMTDTLSKMKKNIPSQIQKVKIEPPRFSLVKTQDESYEVGLFKDCQTKSFQWHYDNYDNYTKINLISFFNDIMKIYKETNKYNLNKTLYAKPENKQLVLSVMKDSKECLKRIIAEQKKIEWPLIEEFKSLLKQLTPNENAITEIFKKLGESDKDKILQGLSTFLLEAGTIKRTLPVTILGQPFLTWPGTMEQKLEVLFTIFPAYQEINEEESLADVMQELFENADAIEENIPVVKISSVKEASSIVAIPLEVIFDAGFGNEVFLVGCGGKVMNAQGEWLDLGNWNTPVKLECTESVKWITKLAPNANGCKIKFLLNAKHWQVGNDITIFPGQENVKIEKINFDSNTNYEKK